MLLNVFDIPQNARVFVIRGGEIFPIDDYPIVVTWEGPAKD